MTTSKAVGSLERKRAREIGRAEENPLWGRLPPENHHSQPSRDELEEEEGAGSWQVLKI